MSNVTEYFEALQHHLALGQERAERLARLLGCAFDEAGRPSVFVLPEARALLSAALVRAADAAADIGIERNDVRWVALVTLLHNASTFVRQLTSAQALTVATLLRGLQVRSTQLRFASQAREVSIRVS